jgi:hypothetical protein
MTYDSRPASRFHSQRVGELVIAVVKELLDRSTCHDRSKTESPEVEVFDEFRPKLKTSTYGSDEYKGFLEAMGNGPRHHYANNPHHPEHFENGVNDMTLVDLIEMLADWKAATERHGRRQTLPRALRSSVSASPCLISSWRSSGTAEQGGSMCRADV